MAAMSSSFAIVWCLTGATLDLPMVKETVRSSFLFSVTTYATAQNASSDASPNMCNSFRTLLLEIWYHLGTSNACLALGSHNSFWELIIQAILDVRSPLLSFFWHIPLSLIRPRTTRGTRRPNGLKKLKTTDKTLRWVLWLSGAHTMPRHTLRVSALLFHSRRSKVKTFSWTSFSSKFFAHLVSLNPPLARSAVNSVFNSSWLLNDSRNSCR